MHDTWTNFLIADVIVYREYIHTLYGAAGIEPIVSCLEAIGSFMCPQTEVGKAKRSYAKQ
jgi:hypothetical protein